MTRTIGIALTGLALVAATLAATAADARISFNKLAANRISFNKLAANRISFNRISLNRIDAKREASAPALRHRPGEGSVTKVTGVEFPK